MPDHEISAKSQAPNQRPYNRRRCTPMRNLCDAYLGTVILATRLSCSQPPAESNDCRLQLHLVAGIRGAQISIKGLVLSALSP